MTRPPLTAFDLTAVSVPLENLLPTRTVREGLSKSTTFRALLASIREVGIVEPLSVFPQRGGKYLILDGHSRAAALRDLGVQEAPCLIAAQDEGYTYNQRVNRIAPIQATRMILKALELGVPEERIGRALDLSVKTVRQNRTLLEGVCPEAVELLRDKHVPQRTLALLKRVKPIRQIEMAEIMVAASTYSASYARALVMTTAKDQLVDPENPKRLPGVKPEDLSRLEREMNVQQQDFRMLDETYNEHVMSLTIARGYLRSLVNNGRVARFLAKQFPELLAEFQRLVESKTLDDPVS